MTLSNCGPGSVVFPQIQVQRSPIANACLFLFDHPVGSTSICRSPSKSLIPASETFKFGCNEFTNDGWPRERDPLSDPDERGVSIWFLKVSTTSIYSHIQITYHTDCLIISRIHGSSCWVKFNYWCLHLHQSSMYPHFSMILLCLRTDKVLF